MQQIISGLTSFITWWRSGILFRIDLQFMLMTESLSFDVDFLRGTPFLHIPLPLCGVDVACGRLIWVGDVCGLSTEDVVRVRAPSPVSFRLCSGENTERSAIEFSDTDSDVEWFGLPQDVQYHEKLEFERLAYVLSPLPWQSMWCHVSQDSHRIPLSFQNWPK